MPEVREITSQEQTEFDSVRAELRANARDASAYTDDFLAYYKDNFGNDYDQLIALVAARESSDDLDAAMKGLDSMLDQYEYENADYSPAPVAPAETQTSVEDVKATYEAEIRPYYEADLDFTLDDLASDALEAARAYTNTAISGMAVDLAQKKEEYDELPDDTDKGVLDGYEVSIRRLCAGIFMIKDSIDARRAAEAAPASPEAPAPSVATTEPPAEAGPKAPEKPQSPHNEAEFLSSMRGDGWKRLAKLEESGDGGKVTVNIPNDKSSPDYLYSRIQHFLGKDEAVKEMPDPENYEVTVNGQRVEWKATDQYRDGTWVAVDGPRAGKRVLVDVGTTTIEWKKKVAQVAEVEPPLPVELPPVAEVEPPVAFLSYDELRPMVVQLKNDATYLKGLPAKRADLVAKKENPLTLRKRYYSQEIAKVDADIATFTGQVEDLTKILNDQVANPAYALALEDGLNPYTDAALALLSLPKPTASASAIADARAVLTNPPPAPVESAPEVMAGENSASGNVG
jgi:hypothetical protein